MVNFMTNAQITYCKLPLISPGLIHLCEGGRDSHPSAIITGIEKAKQAGTVLVKNTFLF